ncbi:tumor necrosis factor receptor superfamily member 4 isoform X2 [Anoplopoma fimbria]|uniref:tumor necrosis factor receptor superfamily member 4 isoform X2 n=1 Tax=Anoplopoma fimbria TaxID=229290 RepID=UPI0023EB5803|nr:tumor necrosis factor receptor superfamily member 4 isoform X2 [Anoplopoma fimbria]
MFLFKLLIVTLSFYDLDALRTCPKGQRLNPKANGCDVCPNDAFQPEENDSQTCKVCTKCDGESGSDVKENCTKETNTKCQCREGFVPWESDSSSCKCEIGFELKHGGRECVKCDDGYFSTRMTSPCQKWKECKCGVNTKGTSTSDVICNKELQGCSDTSNTYFTTPRTSTTKVSLITLLTSQHPRERVHTQRMHTTTTTTTTTKAASEHIPTHIGMAFLILGIIGLLVLTAVTCKLHISPQPAAPKNDSLCRRPVEESGEGSLASLKLNPGEY